MKNKKIYLIILFLLTIFVSSCDYKTLIGEDDGVDIVQIETKFTDLVKKVEPYCIGIKRTNSTSEIVGSAVIIKQDEKYTYALTNSHVVTGGEYKLYVYFGDNLFIQGEVVHYVEESVYSKNSTKDLAIVKFSTPTFANIAIAPIATSIVNRGQNILAVGCPLSLDLYNTTSTGIVSNVYSGLIQHTAAINPGNSGGGLFDLSGRLIGINSSRLIGQERVGFAIDVNSINSFFNDNDFNI